MIRYGVILFHTNSSVMRAEKILLKNDLIIKIIPTPREFSSDCGIAIMFSWDQYEKVKSLLGKTEAEFKAIYPLDRKGI
jgi:hypothetical protein